MNEQFISSIKYLSIETIIIVVLIYTSFFVPALFLCCETRKIRDKKHSSKNVSVTQERASPLKSLKNKYFFNSSDFQHRGSLNIPKQFVLEKVLFF